MQNLPKFYDPQAVDELFPIRHQIIQEEALKNRGTKEGTKKICLLGVDQQIDFCYSQGALFVKGAVEDSKRFIEFIYRNVDKIDKIFMTLDTHSMFQIFHPIFWVDAKGDHPDPFTVITTENDEWFVNPSILKNSCFNQMADLEELEEYARYYLDQVEKLIIWPYHCILGSVGHTILPSIMEAVEYHEFFNDSQAQIELKGNYPLTEHYSAIKPEVCEYPDGERFASINEELLKDLDEYDSIIIGGQALSHCVRHTVDDIIVLGIDSKKLYLLEDCTSPVPGFEEQAAQAIEEFRKDGVHVVKSVDKILGLND